jgi:hypothetical protein
MSFDYLAAKAAIQKAGHTVSAGDQILATDIKELVKFGRRVYGLTEHTVRRGLGNLAFLPEGFPGTESAPVAEEAAPTPEATPEATPVVDEAPAQEVAPVEPAEAPVAEEVAPAEEAPEQETPAAEQTAE